MSKWKRPAVRVSESGKTDAHEVWRKRSKAAVAPSRRLRPGRRRVQAVITFATGATLKRRAQRFTREIRPADDEPEVRVLEPKRLTKGTRRKDPLGDLYVLRDRIKAREDMVHRALYEDLATALDIKISLSHDYKQYVQFTRDPFWEGKNGKRPRARKEGPTLLFVLIFAFRAVSKGRITQMYKYRRVLEWLENRAVAIEDIPDEIERYDGVQMLSEKITREDPRRRRPGEAASEETQAATVNHHVVEDFDPEPFLVSELKQSLEEAGVFTSLGGSGTARRRSYLMCVTGKKGDRFDAMVKGKRGWAYYERTSFGMEIIKLRKRRSS